jgi:putative transposase
MRRGFLCLVAVIDRATRKVLAWRLSNTMEADFCVAALNDAMDAHGRPEIFDTDQGSHVWTAPLGQGLFMSDGKVSGAVMSPACSRGI